MEEEKEIQCGDLFCDYCGDCYHCFADDSCVNEGSHYFDFDSLKKKE